MYIRGDIHYVMFNIFPLGIQCVWCFTVSISGETYIEAGVPYMVRCSVSDFVNNRKTTYSSKIGGNVSIFFRIGLSKTNGCLYQDSTDSYIVCPSSLCSCDADGLATQWIYNTSTDLSSVVTFRCTSTDSSGKLHSSKQWIPKDPSKC